MIDTFNDYPLLIPELKKPIGEQSFCAYTLDSKSLDVLFRIEKVLSVLEPMGADECRLLYIEAIRGSFDQWLEMADEAAETDSDIDSLQERWRYLFPDEKEWFEIGVANFENQIRLYVTDIYDNTFVFANTRNVYTPREEDNTERYDWHGLLIKIEKCLQSVIRKIIENTKSYMDYIERHYPYEKRKGTISMKKWCSILGQPLTRLDDEDLEILRIVSSGNLPYYDGPMTLREYMKVWKVAYCGISDNESLKDESPEEVFTRSAKGHTDDVNRYDPDSEKDFILWCKKNAAYHCFDVTYVCVHLFPAPKAGRWRPQLTAAHEWAIDEMMAAAKALTAEGIPFSMPQAKDILRMHEMKGKIIIDADYADRSRIGETVRRLPEAGYDGVTKKQVNDLIKATRWDKLKEVKLLTTDNNYE